MENFFLVFAEEFIRKKDGNVCPNNTDFNLKEFIFPTEIYPNTSLALEECERYCTEKENCWGCSKQCRDHCRWIAVADCEQHQHQINRVEIITSVKPGSNF